MFPSQIQLTTGAKSFDLTISYPNIFIDIGVDDSQAKPLVRGRVEKRAPAGHVGQERRQTINKNTQSRQEKTELIHGDATGSVNKP